MDHIRTEQELTRLDELRQLRALGIEPYPALAFPPSHSCQHVATHTDALLNQPVQLAGRLGAKRIMGKAAFAELADSSGSVQIYLNRDELCPGDDKTLYNEVFKKLLSAGDHLGIRGHVFRTQTGEPSVHVHSLTLLSKALRPLPLRKEKDGEVYGEGLTDPELRYRQRYADLAIHPEVRQVFATRSRAIQAMRDYLNAQGYLEVDTPVLQPVHGGAAARPFETHHNALDRRLYLRIANELYLKRLVVGGFDGVYEFSRNFRNEGMSRFHNPEFTAIELYVAWQDYHWMMELVEHLLEHVATVATGSPQVRVGNEVLNFAAPYARLTLHQALLQFAGVDIDALDEPGLRLACQAKGLKVDASMGRGKLIDELFGACVEPHLVQPTFILDYPIELSPLAKRHRSKPGYVERFELVCNHKEVANAYTELNDPLDQRQRFEDQLALRDRGDDEAMPLDEDFLRALEYGMPPTTGLGIGIDRLMMMLTNQNSIQDVLLFPQLGPERLPDASPKADFLALGIPPDWVPVVVRAGYAFTHQLHGRQAGQLTNELNGWQRKLNLHIPPLNSDMVQSWLQKAPEPPTK